MNNYWDKNVVDENQISQSVHQSFMQMSGEETILKTLSDTFNTNIEKIREKSPHIANEHQKLVVNSMLQVLDELYLSHALIVIGEIAGDIGDNREEKDIPEMEQIKQLQNVIKFHLNAEKGR